MARSSAVQRRVPARAVRLHTFTELPNHETIWAIAAGCEGWIHIAVCCEKTGGGTVHLYSYDTNRKRMLHHLDVARALGEPHIERVADSTGPRATGLAYPPPGVLPEGEAAVTALALTDEGALCGVTSGRRAHLFYMPRPGLIGDVGAIPGVRQAAEGLAVDDRGVAWGASRDRGGPLFWCDLNTCAIGPYSATFGPIHTRQGPFPNEGVLSLAISCDRTVIAGISERTGRPFLYSPKRRKFRRLPALGRKGDAFGRALAAVADGAFYGSGRDGQIFRLSVDGDLEWLPAHLPCRRGKAYLARVTSWVESRSGLLYGGTEDGSLDPRRRELAGHGRPSDIPDLHALAEGADGTIYGLTGRYLWVTHLVAFRPEGGEWRDLGLLQSQGHFPWTGYEVRALVAGRSGELYAGEHDRLGHLFMYYPPCPGGRDEAGDKTARAGGPKAECAEPAERLR